MSEIMLQQTQVRTVIPYFERFMRALPTVADLARAPKDQVMQLWSGLGYYTRAQNLHRCAAQLVEQFGGEFPDDPELLESLPGIGRSTAAAIAALAFGRPAAILDGNVKRVLARHFGVAGYPGEAAVLRRLWTIAQTQLPQDRTLVVPYTQGLMDLGASLCSRRQPRCSLCPLAQTCTANRQSLVHVIPAARPRKALPLRHVTVLLIERAGEVLLIRRPSKGVWAALWSLPEWPITAAAFELRQPDEAVIGQLSGWLRARGITADVLTPLETLEHVFTHFKLGILPLRLEVRAHGISEPTRADPGMVWLHQSDIEGAALPAPIRVLLGQWAQSTLR